MLIDGKTKHLDGEPDKWVAKPKISAVMLIELIVKLYCCQTKAITSQIKPCCSNQNKLVTRQNFTAVKPDKRGGQNKFLPLSSQMK